MWVTSNHNANSLVAWLCPTWRLGGAKWKYCLINLVKLIKFNETKHAIIIVLERQVFICLAQCSTSRVSDKRNAVRNARTLVTHSDTSLSTLSAWYLCRLACGRTLFTLSSFLFIKKIPLFILKQIGLCNVWQYTYIENVLKNYLNMFFENTVPVKYVACGCSLFLISNFIWIKATFNQWKLKGSNFFI